MFLLHFILTFERLGRCILHFTLLTDSPLVIYFLFLVIKVCIESEWSQGPRVMLECPHIIRPVSSPVHLGSEQVYKFSYFSFLSKYFPCLGLGACEWLRLPGLWRLLHEAGHKPDQSEDSINSINQSEDRFHSIDQSDGTNLGCWPWGPAIRAEKVGGASREFCNVDLKDIDIRQILNDGFRP